MGRARLARSRGISDRLAFGTVWREVNSHFPQREKTKATGQSTAVPRNGPEESEAKKQPTDPSLSL